jgi:hypothetical protein
MRNMSQMLRGCRGYRQARKKNGPENRGHSSKV